MRRIALYHWVLLFIVMTLGQSIYRKFLSREYLLLFSIVLGITTYIIFSIFFKLYNKYANNDKQVSLPIAIVVIIVVIIFFSKLSLYIAPF